MLNSCIEAVVLTYNRPTELLRTVDHMMMLPERPLVRVVDNASAGNVGELVQGKYPEACFTRLERNIGAAARNAGIKLASTPYVALCDDDTWWDPGSLERAIEVMERYPDIAVLNARVLVSSEARPDATCDLMARSPLPRHRAGSTLVGFLAGASVVRRDAILAAGGFEPRFFLGGEEELLSIDLRAAGWSLVYDAELTVHHYPSYHRDGGRSWMIERNRLWTAWLRRRPSTCLRQTWNLGRRATGDAIARRALTEALAGLPWALRNRRRLPAAVEQELLLLDDTREGGL